VVETIRLESGHTLTGIVGSNPTLSATNLFVMNNLEAHWHTDRLGSTTTKPFAINDLASW
jgi:hypothetical protein